MPLRSAQRPALIRPEYKIIRGIGRGGLNATLPPDEVADDESPDMLNLVYTQRHLSVDIGLTALGGNVLGYPQKVIPWQDSTRGWHYVLVTTLTVYELNAGVAWRPLTKSSSNPTVNSTITGPQSSPISIAFTGAATWANGGLVFIVLDNGSILQGVATGTTSPVSLAATLLTGRSIPSGHTIQAMPAFTSDGSLPVSYAQDPAKGWLMWVNGFDPPQRFDTSTVEQIPGTAAASITTAQYIQRFHNVTVLGYVTMSGIAYPYRIMRSATNDSANWITLDAGFDDLIDTNDDIVGLQLVNPNLIVFRHDSVVRASYYGVGQQVFYYDYGVANIGLLGKQASAQTKTSSMIASESGIYDYKGDYALTDIGDKIFSYLLGPNGELSTAGRDQLSIFYIAEIDETWVLYPPTGQTYSTKALKYNHKIGAWFPRYWSGISVQGFGFFAGGITLDWTGAGSWSDEVGSWLASDLALGYRMPLLCAVNLGLNTGFVVQSNYASSKKDLAQSISWYFTTKDFVIPDNWQTLDGIVLYGQGIVGLLEVSLDQGPYSVWGTAINMGAKWTRAELDGSMTARMVRIRLSGTDSSFKLSWLALKHLASSET